MNRLIESVPTPTCRPETTLRIVISAEIVIMVVLRRAFEYFMPHYSALRGCSEKFSALNEKKTNL